MSRLRRLAFVLGFAMALGGCGANAVLQGRKLEDATTLSETKSLLMGVQERCIADLKSPDLDPIRNKVNFNAAEPASLRMLVNAEKPTPLEQQALLAWGSAREKCAGYLHAAIARIPWPPSMDSDVRERTKAGLNGYADRVLQGGNYLTASLYTGHVTFGEFNKQRADLQGKLSADLAAWLSVMDAQDRADTMQRAMIAQQQVDTAVAVLQAAASVACASSRNRVVLTMCRASSL